MRPCLPRPRAGVAARADSEASHAQVQLGPHTEGLGKESPYNAILINGAVQAVPEGLLSQLAEDGRLIVVIREDTSSPGRVVKYVRAGKNNDLSKQVFLAAVAKVIR